MSKTNSYKDIDQENLDIARKLKKESEQIPVKEPAAFEELLKKAEKEQPNKKTVNFRKLAAIAACFVVAIGVGSAVFFTNNQKNQRRTLLAENGAPVAASDYDQIYAILKSNYLAASYKQSTYSGNTPTMKMDETNDFGNSKAIKDEAIQSDESLDSSDNVEKDYSQTNVQTENIDEEDIIRTNGDYIFTLHQSPLMVVTQKYTITISKVDGEKVSTVSTINLPIENIETFCGLYVY